MHAADRLDWSKAVVDGSHHPSPQGRPETGPSPFDRTRTGSKRHPITDRAGVPLAVTLTGGSRDDVTQLMPLITAIPPIRADAADPGSVR